MPWAYHTHRHLVIEQRRRYVVRACNDEGRRLVMNWYKKMQKFCLTAKVCNVCTKLMASGRTLISVYIERLTHFSSSSSFRR